MEKTGYSVFATSYGSGAVVASRAGLIEIILPFIGLNYENLRTEILRRYPAAAEGLWYSLKAGEELQNYFTGEPADFSLPLDLDHLSGFGRAVCGCVRNIAYGEVSTYARVAAEAGTPRACRGVGSVMAANRLPIIIPCHRVVSSDGSMRGYSAPGGVATKRLLLEMEGVTFSSLGRVKWGE